MNFIKHWLLIVKSVLASFIGVQSQNQYEKDAQLPSFLPFLIVGIIMTILLVVTIYLAVNVMLP